MAKITGYEYLTADAVARVTLASDQHQSGSKETAIHAYEKVLETQPGSVLALNNLAWLYYERDDPRALDLAKRAYEAMSIDVQVVFPTPMLFLGMHPQFDMEAILGKAYNRWQVENILSKDPKLKTMMFLPFNDPEAALETIEEFAEARQIAGVAVQRVFRQPLFHGLRVEKGVNRRVGLDRSGSHRCTARSPRRSSRPARFDTSPTRDVSPRRDWRESPSRPRWPASARRRERRTARCARRG